MSKLDVRKDEMLHCGVEYKGVVTKTYISRFVVVIDSQHCVNVPSKKFLPLANTANVSVCCVIAGGDNVCLTVRRKSKSDKCDEDWIAVECWRATESNNNGIEPQNQREQNYVGQVIDLHRNRLCLVGAQSGTLEASIEQIFLFGYKLGNTDLSLIFKKGDNIGYQLDGTRSVSVAWFGSGLEYGETRPTMQQNILCLDFCMKRDISKIFMELSRDPNNTKVLKHKRETKVDYLDEDDYSDETDYNLPYIDEQSIHSKPPINNNGGKYDLPKPTSSRSSRVEIQSNDIELTNKFHLLTPFSGSEQDLGLPEMRDASTQTFATGEVYCFFGISHDS